jgi:membrane protease YdiL (CAAX protease family)
MLPRKSLSPEAVLRLVLGLMAGFCGVMLAAGPLGVLKKDSSGSDMMWSLAVGTLAFYGSALVGIAWTLRVERFGWTEVFGFRSPGAARSVLLGLLAGSVATPLVMTVQVLAGTVMTWIHVEPAAQPVIKLIESAQSPFDQACFGVVTILVAPVVEEMLFRGVFYPSLKQYFPALSRLLILQFIARKAHGWRRRRLAAWLLRATQLARGRRNAGLFSAAVVSLLFACFHGNWLALAPLFLLALLLTALYEKTGNLLAPIMTHSLFNAVNFALIVFEEPLKRLVAP